MRQQLLELVQIERDACKKDVCAACGGRAPQWEQNPVGPNSAGNWIHRMRGQPNAEMLCVASGIFSRELFLKVRREDKR